MLWEEGLKGINGPLIRTCRQAVDYIDWLKAYVLIAC